MPGARKRPTEDGPGVNMSFWIRDAFAGDGNGYPDGAGFARTRGRGDDADLYSRHAEAGAGSEKPTGRLNAEFGMRSAELPTPDPSQEGSGARRWEIKDRTSNNQHPTSNIQHPTSNIQHPTPNI